MDSAQRRNLILNGNMYKVILTLALPIMVNNLIQTLYNLVDGVWVSKLGSVQFAAVSFVWPVLFLFVSIGIGLSIAGTSILSQLVGATKFREANRYATELVAMSFVAGIVFAAAGYFLSPYIVRMMGGTGELLEYSSIYLKIAFLDIPFMFLFFNYNSIMSAQGNTIQPTVLSALSAIINIVLDPVLIFTFDLGVAGAAYATLISKIVLCLSALFMLFIRPRLIKINFKNFRFDKTIMVNLIKVGIPSSIGQSGAALGFMVLNIFVVSYGTATLAAFGMVNRITGLIMQPAMGIGAGLTSIIGIHIGNGTLDRVKEGFRKSMYLTLIMSLAGLAALLIWNTDIVNFFIQSKDDPEVITQGIEYMKFIAFSLPLMGIFSVFQGVFQGSGHTKYSMAMEIGRLWLVRIPMILMFKYFTGIGETGIWFSMCFSNLVICVYGFMIYRKNKWQRGVIGNVKNSIP